MLKQATISSLLVVMSMASVGSDLAFCQTKSSKRGSDGVTINVIGNGLKYDVNGPTVSVTSGTEAKAKFSVVVSAKTQRRTALLIVKDGKVTALHERRLMAQNDGSFQFRWNCSRIAPSQNVIVLVLSGNRKGAPAVPR